MVRGRVHDAPTLPDVLAYSADAVAPPRSKNPVIVEALGGPHVESCHRGVIAILDAGGDVRGAIGNIERAVFARSAVKALQALPLIASGTAMPWAMVSSI